MERMVFWVLLAVTAVVYAILVFGAGATVADLAGAGTLPDLTLTGHDRAGWMLLFDSMAPGFTEAYTRLGLTWDFAFPVLAGVTLARGLKLGALPNILIVFAVLMAAADLAENRLAAQIITAGPEALTDGMIMATRVVTTAKWVLYPVTGLLTAVGLVMKWRQTKKGKA